MSEGTGEVGRTEERKVAPRLGPGAVGGGSSDPKLSAELGGSRNQGAGGYGGVCNPHCDC